MCISLPGMILAVLNQKGGSGKSTLSIHLADALARQGSRVLLIDADTQASALEWSAFRNGAPLFPVVGLAKKTLHHELPQLGKDYAYVVIDGPPRVNEVARSAILAADLVLVPVQPSPYDVWAAKEIVALLEEVKAYRPVEARFVINRKIVNTAIGRDVTEALAGYSLPVLRSAISQRVIFAESAARGETVFESDPQSPAAVEVSALVEEVKELLHAEKGVHRHSPREAKAQAVRR